MKQKIYEEQNFLEVNIMYVHYDDFCPNDGNTPTHVAIIPDGGRRWAKIHQCSNDESYRIMGEKLFNYCKYIYEHGTSIISLYFSSSLNFRRNEDDIRSFCYAETDFLKKYAKSLKEQYDVDVITVGHIDGIPQDMVETIEDIRKWDKGGARKLYICINYNPHKEIENAFLQANIKGGLYINFLEVKEPINILIRTGGAKVISNFLLPQLGFARLFFLDELFNDTGLDDIDSILEAYKMYQLKYGE